jgi:hypothetical protein
VNLTLFLGAGVSRPSGFPLVHEMTDLVLNAGAPGTCEGGICDFLRILYEEQWVHLKKRVGLAAKPNYEQLYHLCDQVERCMKGDLDDASVGPFVQKLEDEVVLGPACEPAWEWGNEIIRSFEDPDRRERSPLEWVARKGKDLIQSVVARALSERPEHVEGFDLLRSLLHDKRVERLFIVTLNHDALVERVLEDEGVHAYADGFGEEDGDLKLYDPDSFESPPHREGGPSVSVIKLHGSVDWWAVRGTRGEWTYDTIARETERSARTWGGGFPDFYGEEGPFLPNQKLPVFLTGGRKELSYFGGVFPAIHGAFGEALRSCSVVVESGFSWNDLALSHQLVTWSEMEGNRVVLLHRDHEAVAAESSGVTAQRFRALVDEGRFVPVERWFGETAADDLFALLAPPEG